MRLAFRGRDVAAEVVAALVRSGSQERVAGAGGGLRVHKCGFGGFGV